LHEPVDLLNKLLFAISRGSTLGCLGSRSGRLVFQIVQHKLACAPIKGQILGRCATQHAYRNHGQLEEVLHVRLRI
jgi:hypothetical protein